MSKKLFGASLALFAAIATSSLCADDVPAQAPDTHMLGKEKSNTQQIPILACYKPTNTTPAGWTYQTFQYTTGIYLCFEGHVYQDMPCNDGSTLTSLNNFCQSQMGPTATGLVPTVSAQYQNLVACPSVIGKEYNTNMLDAGICMQTQHTK